MIQLALLLLKTSQRAATTGNVEIKPWPDAEYMHEYNGNKKVINRSYMPTHFNALPGIFNDIIKSSEHANDNDEALRSSDLRNLIWQTVTTGELTVHE